MPDNPPPTYAWTVAYPGPGSFLTVEAAYPVIEDGCMLLKDSGHKIVFAAGPAAGCTFTRGSLVNPPPAAAPALNLIPVKFPDGCLCTYSGTAHFGTGSPAMRWERTMNWSCKADHGMVDHLAVITADSKA